MQLIRLQKQIDIAKSVLPELVADWVTTKTAQHISISYLQKLEVIMQISRLMEWFNAPLTPLEEFHTLGMSHMRLVQQSLHLDNP